MNNYRSVHRRFQRKRLLSLLLSCALIATSFTGLGSVVSSATEEEPQSSSADLYGLMSDCQDGTILHCFDWKYNDIRAELPNIARAGFSSVQTSPAQPGAGIDSNIWYYLYQPLGFFIGTGDLGTKADLQALCSEAENYGIKVIVDVVANHMAGDHTYIQSDFHSPSLFRWNSQVPSDADARYKSTHLDIGMPDLVSENPYVIAAVKSYVQELKSVGVSGIRWDTINHVQLPSEGCDFLSEVIDPSMYNYGEILSNANGNLSEYANYMSITDGTYGYRLRNAINNATVSSIGSESAVQYLINDEKIPANKVVYWGESHDTWSNDKMSGYSNEMTQNQVDRAYAVGASRKDATALYFSRPDSAVKEQIFAGKKGSTAFSGKEVAAVNHFHNAMSGQNDKYFTDSNTNCAFVCREKGVVVVSIGNTNSRTISVTNTKFAMTTAGKYIDEITGNEWTVTANGISGTIGSTGIAVLYQENAVPQYTVPTHTQTTPSAVTGSVSVTADATEFSSDTMSLTLHCSGVNNPVYMTSEGKYSAYTDGDVISVGSLTTSGTIKVTVKGTNDNNTVVSHTYTYTKQGSAVKIYFDNTTYNWNSVYAYIYDADKNSNDKWPGKAMTRNASGLYEMTVPNEFAYDGKVIFSDNGNSTNRYPYEKNFEKSDRGLDIWGQSRILGADHNWTIYNDTAASGSLFATVAQNAVPFRDNLTVTLHAQDVCTARYTTSDGHAGTYQDGDTITIGNSIDSGRNVTLTLIGTRPNGEVISQSYTYQKDGTSKLYVYFDNSYYNWSTVLAYVYSDQGNVAAWPGETMTKISDTLYRYEIPAAFANTRIIFNNNSSSNKQQYPKSKGLLINNRSHKLNRHNEWQPYAEGILSASTDDTTFSDILQVTLSSENMNSAFYSINGNTAVAFTNGQAITFTDTSTLTLTGTDVAGNNITKSYTYTKEDEPEVQTVTVYFDNSLCQWNSVNAYIYDGENSYTTWNNSPAMTNVNGNIYKIDIPEAYWNGNIIFKGDNKQQYPLSGQSGLEIGQQSKMCSADRDWSAVENAVFASRKNGAGFADTLQVTLLAENDITNTQYTVNGITTSYTNGETVTIPTDTLSPGDTVTVTLTGTTAKGQTVTQSYTYEKGIMLYFENSVNWSSVYAYIFDGGRESMNWNAQPMMLNKTSGLYECVVTGKITDGVRVIFHNGSNGSGNQYPLSGGGVRLEIDNKSHKLSKKDGNWLWEVYPPYTVTFESNGGSTVTSQSVTEGNTATEPETPTKAGCLFDGWYNGATVFDFDTPIMGNITLTAHWTTLTKVSALEATCTTDGNIEYYTANGKYYRQENSSYTEITLEDTVISATGHNYVYDEENSESNTEGHTLICTHCGDTVLEEHCYEDNICAVCGYEETAQQIDWNSVTVTFTDGSNGLYAYTGKTIEPDFSLTIDEEELEIYVDYDFAEDSDESAKKAGKHTITVFDKNDEENTFSFDYYIYTMSITAKDTLNTTNKIQFVATRNSDKTNVTEFGMVFDRKGIYADNLSLTNKTNVSKTVNKATSKYTVNVVDAGSGVSAKSYMKINLNGETYTIYGQKISYTRYTPEEVSNFTMEDIVPTIIDGKVNVTVKKPVHNASVYTCTEMGILLSKNGTISSVTDATETLIYNNVGNGNVAKGYLDINKAGGSLDKYSTYSANISFVGNNAVYTRAYAVFVDTAGNSTVVYGNCHVTEYPID